MHADAWKCNVLYSCMVDSHTSQMHDYLYLEVLDEMVAEGSSGIPDTHHLGKMQIFGELVIGHSMQEL